MVLDVPYTTNPNALAAMHRPQSGGVVGSPTTRVVHLKALAVESNHQEEGQSKVLHLEYELIIALQTFRLLHTTINAWTGERGCRETGGFSRQRSQKSLTTEGPVDYLDRGWDTERLFSGTTD